MASATAAVGSATLASGVTSIAGGAQALMAAVSKANANVNSGSDLLSKLSHTVSDGPLSLSQSMSNTTSASKTQQEKGLLQKTGRMALDAPVNLAKGTLDLAKDTMGSIRESAAERISETTGGKIAEALKGKDKSQKTLLNQDLNQPDFESEIAAFRDRTWSTNTKEGS